jgi:hypothetical protein
MVRDAFAALSGLDGQGVERPCLVKKRGGSSFATISESIEMPSE